GLKRDYDDLIESGEVRMAIGECRRKDGSLIPVEVSRRAQRSGDAWLVVVIMRDIRDRLAAERVIQDYLKQRELVAAFGQRTLANTDLTAVFNEAVQLIATTLHADACHVLEAHADKQGVTVRAAVGVIPYCVEQGAVQILPGSDLHQVLTSGEPLMIEAADAAPNNPLSPVSGLMAPVFEMQGIFGTIGVFTATPHRFTEDEIGFVQSVANILAPAIERNRAEQRLSYLAQFDTLTGLPNRHMLYDRLVQMLSVSRSTGGLIGCMFVDLDRFKDVNDTLGHSMGDLLLIQVSARLKQCLRNNDIVGRLGGDEFAVVLPNLVRAEDADAIAQKVIAELMAPFDVEGHRVHIAASVGIAIHPSDGDDADMLLKNADTAMYCVKAGGRNGYQFYALEMNERALQRIQMENQLRNALENQEFVLHYQPKAELAGGAICGFEALLRWRHPELGLMAPAEFIPLLESTGLIAPVGEWVLRTACEQIESWRRQGITPQPISVNVSARQFQQKDFADVVARLLDETATDPAYIQLELTESLLMRDVDEVVRTLSTLKAMGVRISVDDFGTGHSSLAYLKRFPLDHLKIDQAFIRDSTTDPEDAEIALAIISLAHSLGLKVIAEGVENMAQLGFLQSHGCDEIQGFYFAKPLGAEECTRMLLEGRQLQMLAPSDQADVQSVLLVDDNQDDRELLQHALAPAGYQFFEADSPKAAFDVLAQHSVGIVISDHHMPGMTGVKFLASVRKLYPNAIRIALSGVTDAVNVTNAVNEAGIHKYLSKDWDAMRIRAEVRHACLRREDVS
ncbi:MAG TPA: EAL domain-containing protein, partial [Burkholderiales bacterium]|nr:EAL domain-containing protein [Burkholderiales bacterium]